MSLIRSIKAYTIKEFKESIRFKLGFLNRLVAPALTMVSFFVTYSAVFFGGNVDDLGYMNKSNYVIYLLTAFLTYTFFRLTWGRTNLSSEKGGGTLEGMLLAPGSRMYILAGKASRIFFEIFISVLIFIVALLFLGSDINLKGLIVGSISLVLLFIIFISIDFISTAIGLAHVSIAGMINSYLPRAIALLGCAYYPVDIIPDFAKPLAYLNPLYHAVNLFRSGFMEADLRFGMVIPLVYLFVLAVVFLTISGFFFDWALKKWGIYRN